MTIPFYTVTQDSVVVMLDGQTYTVKRGTANFAPLREALLREDWAVLPKLVTVAKSITHWAKGHFTVREERFYYKDQALPAELNKRIFTMATQCEDPTPLLKFWERLQLNPSHRSVNQLFPFMLHEGIAIDPEGFILAYKSVRDDYMDHHSGTIPNTIGSEHEMPRNQVSDDPNHACHEGFHIGALRYAQTFPSEAISKRIIICRIDPADVVSIPFDASCQKMRTCKYKVIGNFGSQLPSTTFVLEVTADKTAIAKAPSPRALGYEDDDLDDTEDIFEDEDGEDDFEDDEEEEDDSEDEDAFFALSPGELMEQSLDSLRRYATHKLQIVGASKIPGGKEALVGRILEVRRK